jgi:hypothetical protein
MMADWYQRPQPDECLPPEADTPAIRVVEDFAWASWARQHACFALLDGDLRGHHWEVLRTLLPPVADARCGIRGAKTMEMLICMKI